MAIMTRVITDSEIKIYRVNFIKKKRKDDYN
jgi:hypothetical protein